MGADVSMSPIWRSAGVGCPYICTRCMLPVSRRPSIQPRLNRPYRGTRPAEYALFVDLVVAVCEWHIITLIGWTEVTFGQRAAGRQTSRSSLFPSGDLYRLRILTRALSHGVARRGVCQCAIATPISQPSTGRGVRAAFHRSHSSSGPRAKILRPLSPAQVLVRRF
jgi:hypothetical protein